MGKRGREKGKEGTGEERKGKRKGGKGEGREEEGKGGKGRVPPQYFGLEPPVHH